MDRPRVILFICFATIFLLYAVYILYGAVVNSQGDKYFVLQVQIKQQNEENTALRMALYQAESYQTIAKEAARMGLTKSPTYYVIH